MTTIAYNHKDRVIAVDGRMTKGGFIAKDNHNKIRKANNGDAIILCGKEHEIDKVINAWPNMLSESMSCYGFAIVDNVVKWLSSDDEGMDMNSCEHNEAAGSGEAYAVSAMDFNCSAKDAVKYAMTRDIYTGGEIRTIEL